MSANQWFREMIKTLPVGVFVREACLKQQRDEVEFHQRMQQKAQRTA